MVKPPTKLTEALAVELEIDRKTELVDGQTSASSVRLFDDSVPELSDSSVLLVCSLRRRRKANFKAYSERVVHKVNPEQTQGKPEAADGQLTKDHAGERRKMGREGEREGRISSPILQPHESRDVDGDHVEYTHYYTKAG